MQDIISRDVIDENNEKLIEALRDDYDALGRSLSRRGAKIDSIKEKVKSLGVAVPSFMN